MDPMEETVVDSDLFDLRDDSMEEEDLSDEVGDAHRDDSEEDPDAAEADERDDVIEL
jgi:hypothetical protein